MDKTKILFVCLANMDRSPTAEHLYKNHPELEVKSAGIASFATVPVSTELIKWADVVLTMEDWHKLYIEREFSDIISNKKIDYLDIQDDYGYMHPQLQNTIRTRMNTWLQKNQRKEV